MISIVRAQLVALSRTIDTATFLRRPNVVRAHSRAAVKLATGCTWFIILQLECTGACRGGKYFLCANVKIKDGNMKGVL